MANMTTILNEYGNLGMKLNKAQLYVLNRYNYYNDEVSSTNNIDAIKQSIDGISNRLLISHFINAKKVEKHFTKNFMNKIKKSCLISGCAFVRVVKKGQEIELIPYDAYFCTGILNNDNTLSSALSIDDTDNLGNPTKITYYTEKETVVSYPQDPKKANEVIKNNGIIPIIPVIVNQNALKPFGDSFITKKMISDTRILRKTKERADKVQDTLTNANTFLMGVAQDWEKNVDKETLSLIKNVITVTKDADGQTPTMATRENGASQLETKIKDLENSIKYDTTTKEYANMIESIRQDLIDSINLIGDCIMKVANNNKDAKLSGRIDIVFINNDFSEFSAFMDGVLKVNQVVPNYLGYQQLDKLLGIKGNKPTLMQSLDEKLNDDEDMRGIESVQQKMYSSKSILKDYEKGHLTEAQAIEMLVMVDWDEEEAKKVIKGDYHG